MLGRWKHVVDRCDEETGHTWDIWRRGQVVASGIKTRREARRQARELDAEEWLDYGFLLPYDPA